MKYAIEGFSQEYAATLKKRITENGKTKEIKIDCTDLVILRWFVDFFPNIRKMEIDGKEYALLVHKKLLDDLPILNISKKACIDRMQKLVTFGILDYKIIKDGGTFSLYCFGVNYIKLINLVDVQTDVGCMVEHTRGVRSNILGVYGQTYNKDNSIKDSSIRNTTNTNFTDNNRLNTNNIKKEILKEKRKQSFDEIIAEFGFDNETVELIGEWIKLRALNRKKVTDCALRLNLKKLEKYANDSGMTNKQYMEEIVARGWQGFYPITEQQQNKTAPKSEPSGEYDEFFKGVLTL